MLGVVGGSYPSLKGSEQTPLEGDVDLPETREPHLAVPNARGPEACSQAGQLLPQGNVDIKQDPFIFFCIIKRCKKM